MAEKTELQTEYEALKAKVLNKNGDIKSNAKAQDVARLEELKALCGADSAPSDPPAEQAAPAETSASVGTVETHAAAAETVAPAEQAAPVKTVSIEDRLAVLEAAVEVIKTALKKQGILRPSKFIDSLKKQGQKKPK